MTSRCGVDPTRSTTRACDTAIGLELEEAFLAREETSDSIQVDLMKRLRSDFIHTYRTLNAGWLRGVDWCKLFLVTMVGRRVNSFRC